MDHEEVREHDPDVVADTDLVRRTRSGDTAAFGELWRRHYRAGVTVARNMTSSLDADDLVQEAYTRIYHSIINGGGPTGSFRAYLFTSIRNTAAAWGRARRETPYDELDGVEDLSAFEHESDAALDRSLTHQAFRSLPTRWQEVLWYSEIERMKPAEIAPLLGMKPTAVAQLTFRAREGLREAWIQAHLRSVADGSDCQWTIERLGAFARRNLGRRDHAKLEHHLAACVRCSIVASEAKEVSGRLALVLLPLAVGAAGTAGYLASVQGGGVPLVALASVPAMPAMPSAVVQGAAAGSPVGAAGAAGSTTVAGTGAAAGGTATAGSSLGGGAAAIGSSAGAGAGAGAGAVAGAGAAATAAGTTVVTAAAGGAAFAGIGAASGLAAASLVVVGGVVAAAVGLPPTTPEPAPTSEVDITTTTPAGGLVITDESSDPPLELSEPGPGPADIPVLTDDGTAGGADAGSGTNDGRGSGGQKSKSSGDGSVAEDGDAGGGGTDGGLEPVAGDGGTVEGGSTGNGTPTNGTGNGNGGITGNDGTTGNGTPPTVTGDGAANGRPLGSREPAQPATPAAPATAGSPASPAAPTPAERGNSPAALMTASRTRAFEPGAAPAASAVPVPAAARADGAEPAAAAAPVLPAAATR